LDWNDSGIIWNGYVGCFKFFLELDFDTAFLLAVLAGVLYSIYLLMSKSAFSDGRTLFHDNQHPFINGIFRCCTHLTSHFSDFQTQVVRFIYSGGRMSIDSLAINYATQHMRTTRVSLSLLGQAVLTSVLAWFF
jgi:drug/metabolite transporter (DMT)-like permease